MVAKWVALMFNANFLLRKKVERNVIEKVSDPELSKVFIIISIIKNEES